MYNYRVVALSRGEIAQMIGSTVSYKDEFGFITSGEVLNISSDKFDDVKYEGAYMMNYIMGPMYWSKKTKSYRPVKDKDMDSMFFEIKGEVYNNFITINEVMV
jgi:hypothetical protein